MKTSCLGIIGFAVILLLIASTGGATGPQNAQKTDSIPFNSPPLKVDTNFGRMPLYFIPNKGQMDEHVAYYVQGKDKTLYFTSEGIIFDLAEPSEENENSTTSNRKIKESPVPRKPARKTAYAAGRWVVKLEFVGANEHVKAIGEAETEAVVSYFKGKTEEWQTGLETYSRILYRDLWPGIDLVYYGTVNKLKYEFIVHPGADPSQIRLAYDGVSDVTIGAGGCLEVTTPFGGFRDDTPLAYQEIGNERIAIPMAYKLFHSKDEGYGGRTAIRFQYGFNIGDHDSRRTLVLDPALLIYCGYIGGSGLDCAYGIAVDALKNVYVAGVAPTEATFPVVTGPDLTPNGSWDAFVAKVSADGAELVYCGFIGGSASDDCGGIAVDDFGNAFVFGSTDSPEATFPLIIGPDLSQNGSSDAFVAKVNATGTALIYCGYIGGTEPEYAKGIAVDGAGNAYVVGTTWSTEAGFPVVIGPNLIHSGGLDVFVAKVNPAGTSLEYCGYIGGSDFDYGLGIAVDHSGEAFVVGNSYSTETSFPVIIGPDLTSNGLSDVFVAKISAIGSALIYCGYIGGSDYEDGFGIALDGSGCAYVTGGTQSVEDSFPACVGPDLTYGGNYDAFVAKVNASGTALVYCGYMGGAGWEEGHAIAVDSSYNAYITGPTNSDESSFPIMGGPDVTFNGSSDVFIAKVNAGGTGLIYCGYIGGAGWDESYRIAIDDSGNSYITGYTYSSGATFPVMTGPDLIYDGGGDAFVAKISAYDPPPLVFGGHDFDGNNISDIAVYRPGIGVWYISGLSDTQWGAPGDLPVQGNYDLDAATEIAVWRPSGGLWFISGGATFQWGIPGDIPVPHDYDGGGVTDIAIWRPSNGVWYINGIGNFQWGQDGDYPLPGDYDGDSADEIAVWRPTNGEWFIYGRGHSQWGTLGDIPVPADYNGDGTTDMAVYRPSIGMWYIQYSGGDATAVQWGTIGDIPVPGDYDGNGTTDIAIWRPMDGLWYIYGGAPVQYGVVGDIPLVR